MSSLNRFEVREVAVEDAQEEIEDIAAYLSQVYGFDFPLEIIESCYRQVNNAHVARAIAERVRLRIEIDPDDILEASRMARHMARIERAFQYFIDEHLNFNS